jgi:hypothetical protein
VPQTFSFRKLVSLHPYLIYISFSIVCEISNTFRAVCVYTAQKNEKKGEMPYAIIKLAELQFIAHKWDCKTYIKGCDASEYLHHSKVCLSIFHTMHLYLHKAVLDVAQKLHFFHGIRKSLPCSRKPVTRRSSAGMNPVHTIYLRTSHLLRGLPNYYFPSYFATKTL